MKTRRMCLNTGLVWVCLVARPLSAEDWSARVSLEIKSAQRTYQTLGSAVLEIRITNRENRPISFQTVEKDPPIMLWAASAGVDRIKNLLLPKTHKFPRAGGESRLADYKLGPGEARGYKAKIGDLLERFQLLQEPAEKEVVDVRAFIVVYGGTGGSFEVSYIRSNSIKITVQP